MIDPLVIAAAFLGIASIGDMIAKLMDSRSSVLGTFFWIMHGMGVISLVIALILF